MNDTNFEVKLKKRQNFFFKNFGHFPLGWDFFEKLGFFKVDLNCSIFWIIFKRTSCKKCEDFWWRGVK